MKYELTLRPSPTSSVIPVSPNAQYPLSAHQTVAGVERSLANLREQLYETEAQPCLRLPRRYLRTSMMRIVLALISRPDRMMAFHDQRHDGKTINTLAGRGRNRILVEPVDADRAIELVGDIHRALDGLGLRSEGGLFGWVVAEAQRFWIGEEVHDFAGVDPVLACLPEVRLEQLGVVS